MVFEPNLKLSTDGLWFIEFTYHYLFKENVPVADLGGATCKSRTFFIVQNVKTFIHQSNFNWVKTAGANTYDYAARLGVGSGTVYVDHASASGDRLQQPDAENTNKLNSRKVWSYRRNCGVADLYSDSNHQKQITGLTSGLTIGDVCRFTIGNRKYLMNQQLWSFMDYSYILEV